MSSKNPRVDILLATYRGAKFLDEQIESILQQTYGNWGVLVRDDGSSDGTAKIIRSYVERFPDRISLVEFGEIGLGACANFGSLLELSTAEYVMFCDQDDVWMPDKIEVTLNKMLDMESESGCGVPILVHTDLKVVSRELRGISDSFWSYQNIQPEKVQALNRCLVQNAVTGCTVMLNDALRRMARPIPPEAIMHDWWVALIASAFGRIGHVSTPTMLYRQHGNNELGAQRWGLSFLLKRVHSQVFDNSVREAFLLSQYQAREFLSRFNKEMSNEQRKVVACFAGFCKLGALAKRASLLKYGFFKFGLIRNIALFVIC